MLKTLINLIIDGIKNYFSKLLNSLLKKIHSLNDQTSLSLSLLKLLTLLSMVRWFIIKLWQSPSKTQYQSQYL